MVSNIAEARYLDMNNQSYSYYERVRDGYKALGNLTLNIFSGGNIADSFKKWNNERNEIMRKFIDSNPMLSYFTLDRLKLDIFS